MEKALWVAGLVVVALGGGLVGYSVGWAQSERATVELAKRCAFEGIARGYPSTACSRAGLAWNQSEAAVPGLAR